MPTYEYRCESCGHQFDRWQGMSDPPLRECPKCHGPVKRLIGAGSGFIFKGGAPTASNGKMAHSMPECGREKPCCGRDQPCETKTCR
ncbi:zinc ribbon domain-containing protein [bacterium]|nr:zinc ribbon domain-containing protein [candidate division CSSED10-310 bacterium]